MNEPWIMEATRNPEFGIVRDNDGMNVAFTVNRKAAPLVAHAPDLLGALLATQPLLAVAMLEARRQNDGEFLSRLQITFAENLSVISKAEGRS